MTPVDQEHTVESGGTGDCVRAATASLLDLSIEEVPHFVFDNPGTDWYDVWEAWVKDRGHTITVIHKPWEREPKLLGYYLASGVASRGVRHMVVMHNGKLAYDPHPSREGLVEVDVVWLIK